MGLCVPGVGYEMGREHHNFSSTETRDDGDNMEFINQRIQELLDDRKTVIILDDLWETDDSQLNKLKLMLNVSNKMKVLVTTRNEDIANRICTITPFRLSPLNNDMCWDIIKKKYTL